MQKAILILDMPKNCASCHFLKLKPDSYFKVFRCAITEKEIWEKEIRVKEKVDGCPLKPLPEKKIVTADDATAAVAIKYGWNNCLDEIMGVE